MTIRYYVNRNSSDALLTDGRKMALFQEPLNKERRVKAIENFRKGLLTWDDHSKIDEVMPERKLAATYEGSWSDV